MSDSEYANVAIKRMNKERLALMAQREGRTISGLLAILINARWAAQHASGSFMP